MSMATPIVVIKYILGKYDQNIFIKIHYKLSCNIFTKGINEQA